MSQPPASAHARSARAGNDEPLHGEVMPPAMRVVNPARESPPSREDSSPFRLRLGTALLAGALVATLSGVGALEAYRWHLHTTRAASSGPSPTAMALARLNKDVGDLRTALALSRPDEAVKALKTSVDRLKAELDGLRAADAAAVTQLTARLDAKPAGAAPGAAISEVVARLDKMEHDPRLADIASRLDRIEHQVTAPTVTGSIAPQARGGAGQSIVAQTVPSPAGSAPSAKPMRSAMLDNWILRDVYSGIALVEGRSGSIREVVPGETLPGAGEVRSIQRRGRGWIVVTSRGIIDTETW